MSSCCEALLRKRLQMSMVNMEEAELKMEVRDDMRAASSAANMTPLMPVGMRRSTRRG
jgi:hypothetical protein